MSQLTNYRSFQRQVFPDKRLYRYWQPNTQPREHQKNAKK